MPDMTPQGRMDPHQPPAHERRDVGFRGLILFAVGLFVTVAVLQLGIVGLVRLFAVRVRRLEQSRPSLFANAEGQFPAPRLQQDPARDQIRYEAESSSSLTEYGWADRKAGIARIPIDRAMDILAKKGLPSREAGKKGTP